MTNAQALRAYRTLWIELTALEEQLRQLEHIGRPRGAVTQRYDALPGTNDPTAAAMQMLDGLEALAQHKRDEMARLRSQIDPMLAQVTDFRLLVVLQRYYLTGDTDEQVAELLHLSDRYVCRLRNAFLRSQEGIVHPQCTQPAQGSMSAALSEHTVL